VAIFSDLFHKLSWNPVLLASSALAKTCIGQRVEVGFELFRVDP